MDVGPTHPGTERPAEGDLRPRETHKSPFWAPAPRLFGTRINSGSSKLYGRHPLNSFSARRRDRSKNLGSHDWTGFPDSGLAQRSIANLIHAWLQSSYPKVISCHGVESRSHLGCVRVALPARRGRDTRGQDKVRQWCDEEITEERSFLADFRTLYECLERVARDDGLIVNFRAISMRWPGEKGLGGLVVRAKLPISGTANLGPRGSSNSIG